MFQTKLAAKQGNAEEHPNLFDVKLMMKDVHGVLDEVSTYFGIRKIEAKNGMDYLNDRPYCQKLVLDQGYWLGSLLTARKICSQLRPPEGKFMRMATHIAGNRFF